MCLVTYVELTDDVEQKNDSLVDHSNTLLRFYTICGALRWCGANGLCAQWHRWSSQMMWNRRMIPLCTILIYCNAFIRYFEPTDDVKLTDCVSSGICGAHRRCGVEE